MDKIASQISNEMTNDIIKTKCQGIKKDGLQCTRNSYNDDIYCKSHRRMLEEKKNKSDVVVIKKKRGRKPNIIPDIKMEDNSYLPVTKVIVNGDVYLMDFYNNIYTYNLVNPKFIGIKTIYGISKDKPYVKFN